jgi:hypothetical protein
VDTIEIQLKYKDKKIVRVFTLEQIADAEKLGQDIQDMLIIDLKNRYDLIIN